MRQWQIGLLTGILALGLLASITGPAAGTHDNQIGGTHTWQFTAKFLCGTFEDYEGGDEIPVVAGQYETVINVHNGTTRTVYTASSNATFPDFRKHAILLLHADPTPGQRGTPGPQTPTEPSQWEQIDDLKPGYAFYIDCPDIRRMLEITPEDRNAFIEGFVVIEARSKDLPIDVIATYSGHGFTDEGTDPLSEEEEEEEEGFSLQVEDVDAQRIK